MKCFYHKADLDGVGSGAIIKYKHPECEMIGLDYGLEFPWDKISKDETVFMVDFSLQPFEDMIKLNENCNLIWIDHHQSAINDYDSADVNIIGKRKIGEAGCELTWKYCFPGEDMPLTIKYLGRYDVWDLADDKIIYFQYGIKTLQDIMNPEDNKWLGLFRTNEYCSDIIEHGKIIKKYIDNENASFIKRFMFETEIDGIKAIAVNRGGTSSQLFDSVDTENKIMMPFIKMPNGKWTVSLYTSDKDIDCSVIAKKYDGGGHRGAAGFQCDKLPFKIGGNNE